MQVTPLVDLPPLIRPSAMPAPVRMPASGPAPMHGPATVSPGMFGGDQRLGGPSASPAQFDGGMGIPVQSQVAPAAIPSLLAGPAPLPAPVPVSVPPVQPNQSLPPPPPLAPLPPVVPKAVPFAAPAPVPLMPKEPAPPVSPLPGDNVFRGLPVPPHGAMPVGGDAPEAPRPIRTPGSLGDPLDYPANKGRFEGTEPTKAAGVDLDWPTFLRKKRAQG